MHNADMHCLGTRAFYKAARASVPALLIYCAVSNTARGDWVVATAASLSHDDNVGDARGYSDQVSDFSTSGTLSLLQLIPVGESYSLIAGGDLSGQLYDHLSGLRNASIDGLLSLKKKWGLGAFAAWSRAQVSVARSDYEDGYRDATVYRAALEVGKRVDERWNLGVKYTFERRVAAPGAGEIYGVSSDAFSQAGRSFTANAQYALSDRLSLSLGSLLRHGDVVSTTLGEGQSYPLSDLKAAAPDPTFGPAAYAYRLDGTTYAVRLGADYSLTEHSRIGGGFQRFDTHARGGNNYTNSVPQLTWRYQF
ncbi:MAG TPA: hypothetical protein VK794_07480 [Steroidobacteraceae bacterium]|nr:hypothetical protein [Steroidobacteraceae bacterium]